MTRIVESPVGKYITISDPADVPKPGDHPFNHGLDEEELTDIAGDPDFVYGSLIHPDDTSIYVKNRKPEQMVTTEPDKQLSVAIIQDESSYEAHVVTSYHTDYLNQSTVDVKNVLYENKNRFR